MYENVINICIQYTCISIIHAYIVNVCSVYKWKKYISCIDPVYIDIISTQEPIDLYFWHLFQHLRAQPNNANAWEPLQYVHAPQDQVDIGCNLRSAPGKYGLPISIHIPYHLEFKCLKPMAMYCSVVRSSKYKAEGKKQLVSKNSKQKHATIRPTTHSAGTPHDECAPSFLLLWWSFWT